MGLTKREKAIRKRAIDIGFIRGMCVAAGDIVNENPDIAKTTLKSAAINTKECRRAQVDSFDIERLALVLAEIDSEEED